VLVVALCGSALMQLNLPFSRYGFTRKWGLHPGNRIPIAAVLGLNGWDRSFRELVRVVPSHGHTASIFPMAEGQSVHMAPYDSRGLSLVVLAEFSYGLIGSQPRSWRS
jgi:hypothetical protein